MALLPYTVIEPSGAMSPLVVDSPHSGRIYPVDFAYACPLPLLRLAEDAFVDELVAGAAQAGATIVMAEFPRSMIDANRAETDLDPATIDGAWPIPLSPDEMTMAGFGLVRTMCRAGVPLYRRKLTIAEIERRLAVYYRPYHACLAKAIGARLHQLGSCLLVDAHSMPDRIDNGLPRVDFALGDRDGTCCDPALTAHAKQVLEAMGYRVGINFPYKGREIVRRYGAAGLGAQALQLEINRKLYLDELTVRKHSGFSHLQHDLTDFFHEMTRYMVVPKDERLAAE